MRVLLLPRGFRPRVAGRQDELLKDIHNTASECKTHGIPKQAIIDTIDKAYAEGSEEV